MPVSNHHAQNLRAAQLHEYDAQAPLAEALGVTEPQYDVWWMQAPRAILMPETTHKNEIQYMVDLVKISILLK